MTVRELPAATPRVETGPVRFGDDWPGVFIRGDNAFAWVMALDHVMGYDQTEEIRVLDPIQVAVVRGMRDELAACIEGPVGEKLRGQHGG